MWGLVWFLTGCTLGVMFTFVASFLVAASDSER